jgi:uncharacterized membrane protein YadS
MPDPIYVVTPEEFEVARSIERLLIHSRPTTGILFCGVSIRKPSAEVVQFHVTLGCQRGIGEKEVCLAAAILLKQHLQIDPPHIVFVSAARGVCGASAPESA